MEASEMRILKTTPVLQGIEEKDLEALMSCLGAGRKQYCKGQIILSDGDPVALAGVVMEGYIQVISEDAFGNRSILEQLGPGELYGAAFACADIKHSPVSIIAVQDSKVWLIDMKKVLTVCPSVCPFHQQLINNMVYILARKNVALNEKITHISRRSTREKLLSYLSEQSKKAGKAHFTIPFNRQELADYLCVERSAMSAELGKLRKEGIIDFYKSEFWIN